MSKGHKRRDAERPSGRYFLIESGDEALWAESFRMMHCPVLDSSPQVPVRDFFPDSSLSELTARVYQSTAKSSIGFLCHCPVVKLLAEKICQELRFRPPVT